MPYRYQLKMADTDAAGRMFFLSAARIAHESFERLMADIGFGLRQILVELPYVLPVVQLEATYKEPLLLEEWLSVETTVTRVGEKSVTFLHLLQKDSGKVAVQVSITHAVLAQATGQAMALPADLRMALTAIG